MNNYGKVLMASIEDEDIIRLMNDNTLDEEKYFEEELYFNQYLILYDRLDNLVGVYRKFPDGLVREINPIAKTKFLGKVGAKNLEQRCVVDAILDDDIDLVFVDGNAGTGKSFIILATALYLAEMGKPILYTREIVESGKRIGFLKGGIEMKTEPYWRPARMTLRKIQSLRGKYMGNISPMDLEYHLSIERDGLINYVPLQFLRGTSIEGMIMFNDEAQNEELDTLQMFCTRAGEGSKVIIAGSSLQVDDKNLRKGKDGLSLLKKIMAGEPNVASITLEKQERNKLAHQIDNRIALYKAGKLDIRGL